MKTQLPVAPRGATIDPANARRSSRSHRPRTGLAAAAAGGLLALALAACSPSGVATPMPIGSLPPSVNPSAVASVAAGVALAALDQVDASITANTSSSGLSADDAASLTQLTAGLRTALQSGDMTAAKTAVDNLNTKVGGFASKLNSATGQQLAAAVAALKAALPAG